MADEPSSRSETVSGPEPSQPGVSPIGWLNRLMTRLGFQEAPTMRGVVVQYDGERPVSTMSTEELHARVERLVESIHGEALAIVDTLPDQELEARLRAGFVSLVERARAGDTEARRALAPLVEASQVPVGASVVYLPREEQP